MQKRVYEYIYINYPIHALLLLAFCRTQGHPTKASGTHSNICATNWIEERFNQGTMQIYPSTCFYLYSSDLLLFVISLQHQPLIESNTDMNKKKSWCSHWRTTKIKTTSTNLNKLSPLFFYNRINQANKPASISPWTPLLMLSCIVLLSTSIECLQRLWPLIACCQHVSHNTQTNKVSYSSLEVSLQ
jgi:hypothetical protein